MSDATVFETCGIKFPLRHDLPESTSIIHTVPKRYLLHSKQRSDSKLCDVTLIVGEKKLYAHEVVLSSQIPFFRALFNSSMRESTTREVHLSSALCEFDHFTIESLIIYAYTGLLTISIANVQSLMMGAVYLNLDFIIDECARFMRDRIDVDNALSLLTFFKSIAYDKMKKPILKFIDANFVPISHTADFPELNFRDVRSLFKRDSLNVDDEKQVLKAVHRWIEFSSDREKYSTKLLKFIRRVSEKMTDDENVETDSAMSDPNCIVRVRNIKSDIWRKSKRRLCEESHRLIVSFAKESIQIFDPTTSTWAISRSVKNSNSRTFGFPMPIVVNQKIYFIDGFATKDKSGYCFDTMDRSWHSISSPPVENRYFAATGSINGIIYLAGGHKNAVRLSSMHKFDIAKQEWSEGKAMNYRRCAPAFCICEDKVYVFGGNQDYNDMLVSAEYYDPNTDSWTATSPMTVKRCGMAAAVLGGKIYVVGGNDSSETREEVERYDPTTDTWEMLKPMRSPRTCASLIVSCGRLLIIGGYKGIRCTVELSTVEMYDPVTDCWQEISEMPQFAANICALPIPAAFATPFVKLETTFSPSHSSGFGCLVVNGELHRAMHEMGFIHPSEIQHQFIPRAAHGLDVVCQAKEGTGKSTLSAIATLQQLEPVNGQVTALVLCKSREIATKMGETFKDLGKYLPSIKVAVFSGDCRIKKNRGILLNNCPHIVVGTPGRVLALAQSGALKLNNIKRFLIDDCDEMINDQEKHSDLRKLVKYLPGEKQVMVLSTENLSELRTFCKSLVREAPINTEAN